MKFAGLSLLVVLSTVTAFRESASQKLSIAKDEEADEKVILPPPSKEDPFPPVGDTDCTCQSDYDCQRPVCVMSPYSNVGTCGVGNSEPSPTPPPIAPTDCCPDPKNVPTECEVDILIDLLDFAIDSDHKLAAQWLRLAFHDAGTFNTNTNEGGANGCLMTDSAFPLQGENGFLDLPVNTLEAIKHNWEAHPDTCIDISAADIIQFAGLLSSLRQVGQAGISPSKRNTLKQFEWGRPDEPNCDVAWCDNLPGFQLGTDRNNIPLRCMNAGKEIKVKMMKRNGFTAEESAALIGAHTIGLTRSTFGSGHAGPWVTNGGDNAPVFDNAFHHFLINDIVESDILDFSQNVAPFSTIFPHWFKTSSGLNHLDTDIALAFPTQDPNEHPDFHTFTEAFSANNDLFLDTFFKALEKMGKLGVSQLLSTPTACTNCDGDGEITVGILVTLIKDLGAATAEASDSLNIKQQMPEFKEPREFDTVPVKTANILTIEESKTVMESPKKIARGSK